MTSWYSNILTKTTSQISSLRSTLLSSEADGDTEDDTHVCRVLRNYYTDKGRPLPGWLPPDPKAAAQVPQTLYAQPQVGSRYGGLGAQGQQAGGGGLSSLWDSGPAQQQPPQAGSLRAGRQGMGGGGGAGGGGMLAPQRGGPGGGGSPMGREAIQPRPLPSQREGSYQNAMGGQGGGGGGGASAQDRLKQRLWGAGRTASPSQGQSAFQPPPANSVGGQGNGGGGGSSYEDRFAPGGPYGGGSGGGYGQAQGQGQRRQGLPSGPRGYR